MSKNYFLCFFSSFILIHSSLAQVDVDVQTQSGGSVQMSNDIALTSDSSAVVVGITFGNASFGSLSVTGFSYDMFLVKYDIDGNPIWANRGGGTSWDAGNSVTVSPFDDIYVVGFFIGSASFGNLSLTAANGSTGRAGYLVKYDDSGNEIWAVQQDGTSNVNIIDVATDLSGNVFTLTGFVDTLSVDTLEFTTGGVSTENYLVTKYDSSGSLIWTRQLNTTDAYLLTSAFYKPHGGIAVDTSDNVYVTANFLTSMQAGSFSLTSSGSYDAFLLKLNGSSGNPIWLKKGGGTSVDFGTDITIDNDQKIILAGRGYGSMLFGSLSLSSSTYNDWVVEYNTAGLVSDGVVISTGSVYLYTSGISVDIDGNWLLTSSFNNALSFGSTTVNTSGGVDPYVLRYNYENDSLSFIWTPEAAPNNFELGRGSATLDEDHMWAVGNFNSSMDFGINSLTGSSYEGFLMRLGNCGDLQANISSSGSASICAGESVTLSSDTNALYEYQWLYNGSSLGGEVNADYTTANAGNYSVVVDSNGCVDTSNIITVTVNPLPNVTHSNLSSVCDSEDPFQLTGGSPAGGVYTGGAIIGGDTFDPSIANSGSNSVVYTYTDANGCADSVTKSIVVNQSPGIFTNTISACEGDASISLASSAFGYPTGGTHSGPGVSGNSFDPNAAGAGVHTLYYTSSNGCVSPDSIVATVTASPNVSLGSIPNACVSESFVSLAPYGSPFGGSFSGTGVSSPFFYPGIAGVGAHNIVYSVTSNGCTSYDTTTIIVDPIASATLNSLPQLCEGDNDLVLSSYASPSGGSFSGTGVNDSVFSPSTAGTGSFIITYTISNACGTDTAQRVINVGENPTINLSTVNVSCKSGNDGSATATGSGGASPYSYAWSSGATTSTASSLAAGTYTVTVIDDNGCSDSSSVMITEPATAVNASITTSVDVSCNGGNDGSATASGSGGTSPYSYAWSNSTSTSTATGLSAGTYTVTVTDDNGCTDTETVSITEPTTLTASISSSNVSCNGGNDGSATASGSGGTSPYSYAWSNSASTATATGLSAGTYTVTVTDDNGCTDTETVS
ncbi:MAG: SprB repeat-containing protein, partial [Salibacteraceae bacterium]